VVHQATPLEYKFTANFARSMSVVDAMSPVNMLCYEMNGKPLPAGHGFPCRLIAPGWFGVANVKWLTRIEVVNHRFLNRFMGRDYVTIREEQRDGKAVYMETSVGRQLIKSAPARVVERNGRYQIQGMAWGPKPITMVEVKIDNGNWTKANLAQSKSPFEWQAWSLDWSPAPGGHTRSPRGRSTPPVLFNRRWMTRSLPTRRPTGRATDKSPAKFGSHKSGANTRKFTYALPLEEELQCCGGERTCLRRIVCGCSIHLRSLEQEQNISTAGRRRFRQPRKGLGFLAEWFGNGPIEGRIGGVVIRAFR
jgi:hypothetical protein